jgi:hypothetical protein
MLNVPMPQGLSEEERLQLQKSESDRMFNFAEEKVMEYICYISNVTPKEMFITPDVEKHQPVYTAPIKELDDARIEFSLDMVEHDYKLTIPANLVDDTRVNHVLGFIYHSIKEVFNAVVNKNVRSENFKLIYDTSFHLEIDDDSLTFFPIYLYPHRRREIMLTQMKTEISEVLNSDQVNNVEKDIVDNMNAKYKEICQFIEGINYDADEANALEVEKNNEYKKYKRLGVKMNIVKLQTN